ncbi:MAG: cytochrome c biogenesis protein ResB [Alistipes sp.]|nr:cytochrome c biogenesis protein ResB [Alistipes sp.]
MTLQWGYKRAFGRCASLFVAGTALQMIFGDIDNGFLRYPWGLIIALNYLYLLVLIHFQKHRWKWLGQLADHYACTSALASMVVMTIIFGLTRQDPATEGWVGALGFSRMTSSWAFNLLLLYFTTTTGLAVMEDLQHIRKRRVAAVLSHAAVFVVLVAGIFGSGDKLRVSVTLQKGQPSHWGVSREGEQVDLPFVLTLDEFRMEEYAPKLYVLDAMTEQSSRDFLSVEPAGDKATIDGWHLTAVENLDMAGHMPDSDEYRAMEHVGAAPAVYVRARNLRTGMEREGWVSCGSFIFEPSYLFLDDRLAVAMPRREAKHYLSRLQVVEEDGTHHNFDIEVNHPARVGAWRIYQMGYDTQRGRWSEVSVVECVRDGWYSAVHIALWTMLVAGVVMFLTAGGRKVAIKQRKEAKQ